ncbi:glycosyltransferase [Alteromonas facilis]|uniref:glycosyltransferase n=1 Tax=Alteromonas facilis TaxID=2048004 RepID=UPI000C284912|nr:glycosyltransferase family 4 protein [Alteromonas facilis]
MHAVVVGYVWPEPNSSAAGQNMLNLMTAMVSEGWRVDFLCAAKHSDNAIVLTDYGVTPHDIVINDASFDSLIAALAPDIVIFDRFMIEEQFSWRVRQQCPQALCVLNTEDLHALRSARQQQNKSGEQEVNLHSDLFYREVASIMRSDITLLVSEFEQRFLQHNFAINKDDLQVHPLMPQINSAHAVPDFSQRQDFVFIGSFRHEPNWDCVRYLKETIWPQLSQKLKTANLRIYGSYPPPKAMQFHAPKQRFFVEGWAENAQQTLAAARICLAPLRFGAGVKGKFLDAFQVGTPCMTTPLGSEGITDKSNWPGYISESPDDIINHAVRLYTDENAWYLAHQQALQLRLTPACYEAHQQSLIEALVDAHKGLEQRRKRNFVGAMLRHHSHASTKYMGQWIEAKTALKKELESKEGGEG